jgi:hypothetical protein
MRFKKHIESWNRSNEPVILVYTNAEKEKNGNKYLDLKNPKAWWMRMDDYQHDGTSILKIPRSNLFQEHTKGEMLKLIKPFIKDWRNCIKLTPQKDKLILWHSLDLKKEAKEYYKEWKASNPAITLDGKNYHLNVSRTGWRHINNKARKERVSLSLRLLPIAKMILEQSKDIRPVVLRSRAVNTFGETKTQHLGYRARVFIDGYERKVQVVVKKYINLKYGKEKVWFYSVHIVK